MVTQEEREVVMKAGLGQSPIPIIYGAGELFDEMRIMALPQTLVINPGGETVHTAEGYSPDVMDEIAKELEKMPASSG